MEARARQVCGSVFAGQQEHAVGEVESDFLKREIGPGDVPAQQLDAIAVVCDQLGRLIGVDPELPGDERFAAQARVHSSPRHIVDQPEGIRLLGEKMYAFGKEHRTNA